MKSLSYSRFTKYLLLLPVFVLLLTQKGHAQFVKGADIGWLSQMETTGYNFFDTNGTQMECLDILQSRQINTVRLRVWVNPSNDKINGHCSKKEVAEMALRAKNRGMRVMIDFHYSDSWADPGKQNKPAAWASHSFSQLLNDVYNHTYEVLDTLKAIGATPDWAQIGNEISGGMLWPDGSTNNWDQLAQLLNKGYDATKAVDTGIKVVIQINNGQDNSLFRWFFDNAESRNVNYDIIGMSYYPYWDGQDYTETIDALGNNMKDMVSRYGKPVMVVETGGLYNQVQNTYDMLIAVIKKVVEVPDKMGLGVIFWEPQGEKSWSGYNLSCWGTGGKPTRALNAFMYDVTTGMEEMLRYNKVTIYPNPAIDGCFTVDLSMMDGVSEVRIYDMVGHVVKELNIGNNSQLKIVTDLQQGIYLLDIFSRGRHYSQKLVVSE
jgi:arabinogalactan endo-1,4-beta-galactosidase